MCVCVCGMHTVTLRSGLAMIVQKPRLSARLLCAASGESERVRDRQLLLNDVALLEALMFPPTQKSKVILTFGLFFCGHSSNSNIPLSLARQRTHTHFALCRVEHITALAAYLRVSVSASEVITMRHGASPHVAEIINNIFTNTSAWFLDIYLRLG